MTGAPTPRRWCSPCEASWAGPGGCPLCGADGHLGYDPPPDWPPLRPPQEPVAPSAAA